MLTKSPLDLDDACDSLTGFEELAIEERFGLDPGALQRMKPLRYVRSVGFAVIARDLRAQDVNDPDGKAYQRVMEMTQTELNDFFGLADEDEQAGDEQPVATPPGPSTVTDAVPGPADGLSPVARTMAGLDEQ